VLYIILDVMCYNISITEYWIVYNGHVTQLVINL